VFLLLLLSVACCLWPKSSYAQSEAATVTGRILDPSGAAIPGVTITVLNTDTGLSHKAVTNQDGLFTVPFLPPGNYRVEAAKTGFKTVIKPDVILHVQDVVAVNFSMILGSVSESVTVEAGGLNINTTDASVSTVVDRQFAENLPLNGRSFQSLIYLTPGVTLNSGSSIGGGSPTGQFTVNGQRASSNYWMVDGVSANIGTSAQYAPGPGASGGLGSFNVLGGTNSLVSVDAMQEFRIQTSTYAPEFGRTPGGQVSILTRSGTNAFHGSAFDYLRNYAFDAKNWFADAESLPKAQERQNDFGGVLGGPIMKDKLFFFFSYEGLRLRQPETVLSNVPDLASRQAALPAEQPFLNAFSLPNPGAADIGPGLAPFDASFVVPSSFDAYSLRLDYSLSKSAYFFARYSYSPSQVAQRGDVGTPLSNVGTTTLRIQTGTLGLTWSKSPQTADELRFNYSTAGGAILWTIDNFGGATPVSFQNTIPAGINVDNMLINYYIIEGNMYLAAGRNSANWQHQYNWVDTLSIQEGTHSLKFGADYRRLTPYFKPPLYIQEPAFATVADAEVGNAEFIFQGTETKATFLFQNLGVFAQDTWKVNPRLSLTYGLRWDVDFTPSSESGPSFPSVTGFSLNNLSNLALGPTGAPIFSTKYGNVAPRVGIAYQLSQDPNRGTVLRGGFGVFYDLATSTAGSVGVFSYPFETYILPPGTYPLAAPVLPPIIPPGPTQGTLIAFDPGLTLPYTLEWSFAAEQALGPSQTFTASYIGSAGRRLLATESITNPNPNYAAADLIANGGKSNYNALQAQFQRRLSQGFQALASYTWSHSIDDGSYGEYANGSIANANINKGNSDFDIRQTFSAALTYDLPALKVNRFAGALLHGWSFENILQVHSAPPVEVVDGLFAALTKQNSSILVRPDVVPGQPLYLYGSQYAGGKALNPNAFMNPPTDPVSGEPLRQGDLGRNALRAFGLTQWDFALHRDFPIREGIRLQFRAEMFNLLNHPNFAPFDTSFGTDPLFGLSTASLGQYLVGPTAGNGGYSSLYNLGGPRSIQLALKLFF
jgi:hypothetical protein